MAAVARKIIRTTKAALPVGPYSQAVVAGNTVYVSGQLALHPESGLMVNETVTAEADMALTNLKNVLEAADSSLQNVVKTTILLQDINDWPTVNVVYSQYFTDKFPARAAYQVGALPKGAKVEIEAVAIIGKVVDLD